jgi:signal transduction histidine kinase
VAVTDDGSGQAAPGGRGGQGLIGMRQRAQLVGGAFDAGPRDGGGFCVLASLPTRPDRRS